MKDAMKRLLVTLLLIVNIFPVSALAQTTADARIKRVEQGLLPVVLIKGDPGWSIAERMKFYKVPALSIAVIKDFKIEWAKAYGVTDLETGEPATTETLFQAGSISKSVNATFSLTCILAGPSIRYLLWCATAWPSRCWSRVPQSSQHLKHG
jgi:CubicO group peptidase (beta-lactamase class C family)